MSGEACPLPVPHQRGEAEAIEHLLDGKTIALIGASDNPMRPACYVGQYLINHGYDVIPVNPKYAEVLGRKCYPSVGDIPVRVDVVNVFRRPNACADVARQSVAAGAGGMWLQAGITNDEAKQIAAVGGLAFVENRCIMVEHSHRRRKR